MKPARVSVEAALRHVLEMHPAGECTLIAVDQSEHRPPTVFRHSRGLTNRRSVGNYTVHPNSAAGIDKHRGITLSVDDVIWRDDHVVLAGKRAQARFSVEHVTITHQ